MVFVFKNETQSKDSNRIRNVNKTEFKTQFDTYCTICVTKLIFPLPIVADDAICNSESEICCHEENIARDCSDYR